GQGAARFALPGSAGGAGRAVGGVARAGVAARPGGEGAAAGARRGAQVHPPAPGDDALPRIAGAGPRDRVWRGGRGGTVRGRGAEGRRGRALDRGARGGAAAAALRGAERGLGIVLRLGPSALAGGSPPRAGGPTLDRETDQTAKGRMMKPPDRDRLHPNE